MAVKSNIDEIADLLTSESSDIRIAAAIVLGELGAKNPSVQKGLRAMLESEGAALQRVALEAIAKVGAKQALPQIFPLLNVRDASVRERAAQAVVSAGESVVPTVMQRLEKAGPAERRALEMILTHLGGVEAYGALLDRLTGMNEEELRNAVLELRPEIKGATGKKKTSYFDQTSKCLDKLAKAKDPPPATMAAAVKLLGYLEENKSIPQLLSLAKGRRLPSMARQEALIALRFALDHKEHASKVMDALIAAAESDDRTLSQTGLITLGNLRLPPRLLTRFVKLASHPDIERARFAIAKLSEQTDKEATKVLVELLGTEDRTRAELAASALRGKTEAVAPLVTALTKVADPDRAWLIRKILIAAADQMTAAHRKKLLDTAEQRLTKNQPGWEALIDVARHSDAAQTAKAMRALVAKLKKARKPPLAKAALQNLCAHDEATNDDRYALISLELAATKPNTAPGARLITQLDALLHSGYDVSAALRKDRGIGLDELYTLGFHLVELEHPLGEELLTEVVAKAGRKKMGKMAQNKLKLAGFL